eukprot:s3048_g6.t1
MATAPFQLETLEDQWLPHYQELEAGVSVSLEHLVGSCAAYQALRRLDGPLEICLQDLPCLPHLEQAFRAISAGKAAGYDRLPSDVFHRIAAPLASLHHDLFMKTFLWQPESIQAKRRTGQQVLYGSQAVRTFGALCDSAGVSCAILFLDLSNAFHHLIREAVVGADDCQNLEPVLQVLYSKGLTNGAFATAKQQGPEGRTGSRATVRAVLQGYGFELNLSKGKTSAVLTLRGPGSADLRKQYQLCATSGISCQFADGATSWLHFTATYRHLGTLFTSKHDLASELSFRVGMAKTAFNQLARPLLTNKHLPVALRLQFFNSLVATKLYFGLGAWVTPSPKQLQYLQTFVVSLLKRVLRIGHMYVPPDRVLAMAGISDVRVRLALDRLMYAQRLFRTGPAFLHNLIHREFACVSGSWLHGLKADLAWMEEVLPNCLPQNWATDLTPMFDLWQSPHSPWDRLVKRCWKMHLAQTGIMVDARRLHGHVFRVLKQAGATFNQPADASDVFGEEFSCFCGRNFASMRGLLAHQRRVHQMFSVERQFLQGCTCLHCGKFLWSTQRLQQHLAYIPKHLGYNPCFHALQSRARQVPYEKADLCALPQFAGLNRRGALVTLGPSTNPRATQEVRHDQLTTELIHCRQQLEIRFAPDEPLLVGERIGERLAAVTMDCFHAYYPQGPEEADKGLLADAWVDVLCTCFPEEQGRFDPWLDMIFLLWGEHWLPDAIASFEDGVAERDVDDLFADFVADLDRYTVCWPVWLSLNLACALASQLRRCHIVPTVLCGLPGIPNAPPV